jgi:hypothetical protein
MVNAIASPSRFSWPRDGQLRIQRPSHQTVMAREVPDGTANDRTFYATLCLSRNRRYGNDERQCSAA